MQLTGVTFPPIVEITSLECTSRAFPVVTSSESQLSFVTVLQEPVEKCMTKEGIISSKEQLFSKKKLIIFLFEKVGGGVTRLEWICFNKMTLFSLHWRINLEIYQGF